MEQKVFSQNRIDGVSAIRLLSVAIFFDLISLIPGINAVSGVIAQSILPLMFAKKNVNIFTMKKIAPYAITWIIEFLPGISAIPAITIQTILYIYLSHREDTSVKRSTPQISK